MAVAAPLQANTPLEAERDDLGSHISRRYTADLEGIVERRYIRVLTSNNSFDYFIDRGHHDGYQYQMVRDFTRHLNRKYSGRAKARAKQGAAQRGSDLGLQIQFELIPVQSDQLIPMLLQGRADMIAARMTITPERERRILFSRPYRQVDEQLLTHRDLEDIDTLEDLSGRTVAVRDSSSYRESLQMESERLVALGKPPIQIELVDSALETENILALVAAGHFDFTLADSIMAETAVEIFPTLRVVSGQALRKGGQLAWATHPGATGLKQEMDEFLLKYRQGTMHGNAAVNKYFQDIAGLADRVQSDGPVTLSPYDEEIRRVAEHYCFDWRLMAAVAYQESRFKQHAHNPSGATGLFQIKPQTAAEPYIDVPDIAGDENAANNIRAGIKYIAWIKGRYFDSVPEMREGDRMRMTLAAYNAGPRTVRRAQHRAESMGLDRTRWFRHVELGMLDLNRAEPVKYVSEINQHYLSYLMLGVKRSAGPQGERRDAPMRPGDTSKRNDCPASP